MALDAPSPRRQDTEGTIAECTAIEAELAALKATFDQYFLGLERVPPLKRQEALKKRLTKLQNGFIKQTTARFRVNTLVSKFVTYERLWEKSLRERENGTFRRDLERARRKAKAQQGNAPQRSPGSGATERIEEDVDLDLDMDFDLDALAEEAAAPTPVTAVSATTASAPIQAPAASAQPAATMPRSGVAPPPPVTRAPVIEHDELDALLEALSEVRTPVPPAAMMPQVRSAATRGLTPAQPPQGGSQLPPPARNMAPPPPRAPPAPEGPPRLLPTPVPGGSSAVGGARSSGSSAAALSGCTCSGGCPCSRPGPPPAPVRRRVESRTPS